MTPPQSPPASHKLRPRPRQQVEADCSRVLIAGWRSSSLLLLLVLSISILFSLQPTLANSLTRARRIARQRTFERSQNSTTSGTEMKSTSNSTQSKRISLSASSNQQQKRFKTSLNNLQLGSVRLADSNNNQPSNDINNNTISGSSDEPIESHQRNVNSINGTIDLSQYGQSDVDRLYGDALLVYFKNFNE